MTGISTGVVFPSMHQDNCGYLCMIIQPALKEDAGWYTVSAKNEAGIVSTTARLDVHGEPRHTRLYLYSCEDLLTFLSPPNANQDRLSEPALKSSLVKTTYQTPSPRRHQCSTHV